MPENKNIIIAPETEPAGMDLDLFLRIMPSVRVGDRIVSTVGIEHVEYQDVALDTGEGGATEASIVTQLAISYQSGCVYFFDAEEEIELEQALKTAIQKSEEMQKQQMTLATENAALKQEIGRLMASQMQGGKIVPPWGKNRH